MTRRTERICYLTVLILLVGFLAYDWYDRNLSPKVSDSSTNQLSVEADNEFSDSSPDIAEPPNNPHQVKSGVAEANVDQPGRLLDWPARDFPGEVKDFELAEPVESEEDNIWAARNQLSEQEIDQYYDQLAQQKLKPKTYPKLVDWERTKGEKPDWMVMEEWWNLQRFQNYLNPGPVHTTSYTDVYGNRHHSFEDRSGRIDVFDTWGREYTYFQPK
ncbi:MAG: hypothetical protein KC964_19335 [Candidatus Omnitrophica bacterium]|nr:hypothetical protein [Candidatus Omnitrophota bacterium]